MIQRTASVEKFMPREMGIDEVADTLELNKDNRKLLQGYL